MVTNRQRALQLEAAAFAFSDLLYDAPLVVGTLIIMLIIAVPQPEINKYDRKLMGTLIRTQHIAAAFLCDRKTAIWDWEEGLGVWIAQPTQT